MKNLLLLLCITLAVGACKKGQDNVKPAGTASNVIGTYTLSSFHYQNKDNDLNIPTMPVVVQGKQTYFGSTELSETTDPNKATMVLRLTLDNRAIDDIDLGEVDVQKSGSTYTLLSDGTKFATISGNAMQFDLKGTDVRIGFTAKR